MNRITVAQIEAFYWTATLGSVDGAARHLSLSQPTISLRLKALEHETSVPLFQRVGRGVRPTPDGYDLLPEAKRILEGIERLAGRGGPVPVRGTIRVGFAEGFALVCLSRALELLHQLYPDLNPELMVATTSAVEPELHAHRLDLAFLVNPTDNSDFTLVPLGAQETCWIASARWSLPALVSPHDLANLPIISNPQGSINYRQVREWFASAGVTPARVDICNSVAMLAHVVTAGVAIGIYPSKMAEEDVRAGVVRLLRTSPPVADTPIYAKFAKRSGSPNIRAFIATVRQVLSSMDYLTDHGTGVN
ncbi:LysR family transcriptional regulator [Mesorhizobium sp. M0817]|uniref:LysR family transcriptional regulator n=1 Tax=unclassified Mesorhizobium TaxID=325217 RepID=UPI00333C0478